MKHQSRRKQTLTKLLFTNLLMLFLIAAMSVPVFAASNKAVRVECSFNAYKENETDEEWDKNTFAVGALLPGTDKLAKTMTYSARVIIPESLSNSVGICMDLRLFQKNGKEYIYKGMTSGRYWFYISGQGDDVSVDTYDRIKDTHSKKYVSVRKSGKNYILTIKNALFQEQYHDAETNKDLTINTKTKYVLYPVLVINGSFPEKTSGYIDVDEFSVKTKNTHKITFNKKNYKELQVYCFYQGITQPTKLVPVK